IFNLSLSANWEINDHFYVDATLDGSPPGTLVTDLPQSFTGAGGKQHMGDLLLSTRTWNAGGIVGAGYDTSGDSNAETAVDVSASVLYIDALQTPTDYYEQSGTVVPLSEYQ